MCGIVGFQGSFEEQALHDAISRIQHRGPDDSGFYFSFSLGLGHTRLSIQDPSSLGHQPMVDEDTGNTVIFNGEIYNFTDLRDELESIGVTFKGQSDTEVLLKLYAKEGEKMLNRLNGIFAFALWDVNQNHVFMARDAMGVKPLYYGSTNKGVAFSSEIKSLLRLLPASTSDSLDLASVELYFTFLWCPGEGTPLQGVKKLSPGSAMILQDGQVKKLWSWYTLPVFRIDSGKMPERDAISGTEQHLRAAVHRQMVSDVPVGAFLSGGLDSSAIVAFAKEINPNISCFTIAPVGGDESGNTADLPYARRVADYLGVQLETVAVDSSSMAKSLEMMVEQLDEPLADPAPLNVLFISQLARDNGIKVLLSGAGGDDIFTGYRRHWALQLERYWRWLPYPARVALSRMATSLDSSNPFSRRIAKMFRGADLEGDEGLVSYLYWTSPKQVRSLFSDKSLKCISNVTSSDPLIAFLSDLNEDKKPLERLLTLEQRFFLSDHNLTYTDKMSMAAGVETRVPFLDLPLMEFAQKIPTEFKQKGKEGKWVLKKAMEPYLPHDVIYRPKSGFGAPLRNWIRFELRELLGGLLSTESIQNRGLFQSSSVQKLIADNDAGRIDASYTLFSLMCIEIWCRKFIDNQKGIIT